MRVIDRKWRHSLRGNRLFCEGGGALTIHICSEPAGTGAVPAIMPRQ